MHSLLHPISASSNNRNIGFILFWLSKVFEIDRTQSQGPTGLMLGTR
jgi:hypothetical protein